MIIQKRFSIGGLLVCMMLSACGESVRDYSDQPVNRPKSLFFSFDNNLQDYDVFSAEHDVENAENNDIVITMDVMPTPFEYRDGLKLQWNNYSGDMKGVFYKALDDLEVNKQYEVVFELDLITYISDECDDDQSQPAGGVTVKAALLNFEPQRDIENGVYEVNVRDRQNADHLSDRTVLVGDIGLATPECATSPDGRVWERKIIRSDEQFLFTPTSENAGGPWLYISLDSAYEGVTEVYFADFRVIYKEL